MLYIILKSEFGERKKIIDTMAEKFPERSEEIMTVAEELREEGREEGKKELVEVMTKMRRKLGNESFELIDKLKEKNVLDQLDKVSKAIDKANNLKEFEKMI